HGERIEGSVFLEGECRSGGCDVSGPQACVEVRIRVSEVAHHHIEQAITQRLLHRRVRQTAPFR
ncbi:MAG TPA: hypothetical protein H9899_12370, partial [Candidatus Sphingomonas excrementigallinarum]|nr:hypothetical protein [Candidatus Sphingomonas excrementigallinarum]